MKKKNILRITAALCAGLMLSGCASELKDFFSLPEVTDDTQSAADNGVHVERSAQTPAQNNGENAENENNTAAPVETDYDPNQIAEPNDERRISMLIADDCITDYNETARQFEERFGGTAEVKTVAAVELLDKISELKLSGDSPDIASFDNAMMFPYAAAEGIIEPIDLAVNLNAQKWDDYRALNDMFYINGWHYVSAYGSLAYGALFYDKNVLAANGIANPKELYQNGEWTYEKLDELLRLWHEKGGKYGLSGDYAQQYCLASGQPIITYDEGTNGFENNIYSEELAYAEEILYKLRDEDICPDSQLYGITNAMDSGALFFGGSYGDTSMIDENSSIQAVPFPSKDGDSLCYRQKIDGLVLVDGAKNLQSARCIFELARRQNHSINEQFKDVFYPDGKAVYDYGMGISEAVSGTSDNPDTANAILQLMYSAPYQVVEWESVTVYASENITRELCDLNDRIRQNIFGDNGENE